MKHGPTAAMGIPRLAASLCLLAPAAAYAVDTVYFSTADAGVSRSVGEWGVDTAWPSYDNVRQSIFNMGGAAGVDVVRLNFFTEHPLVDNGNGTYALNAAARSAIDNQLNLAALAGSKPLALVPTVGATDAAYLSSSGGVNVTQWARLIKATQEYVNSKSGFTTTRIASIEPFNEPDYWTGQGTSAQLNSVIQQLKTYPVFNTTKMQAGSTLSSGAAQGWFNGTPAADQGSSHLLGGSMSSYVAFMDNVRSGGKTFANPELHSLGEAIIGAEHGMASGIWWADVLRARGQFIQASHGTRLGYRENLDRQSAAAVYRGPNGKIQAFAGGVERFGRATSYRFVSTDRDVYFNGIPVREYMLQTKFDQTSNPTAEGGDDFQNFGSWSNQGAYADVDTMPTGIPALDGYRWKIVNSQTGQVMEVASSGTGDGALIRSATDSGGANQRWNIVRTRDGYFQLFNANSGRTAEVANGSLGSGASVRQWGTADNQIQQWFIESAASGGFFLRNAYTLNYLTSSTTNSRSSTADGSGLQRWQFVLDNPAAGPRARYAFAGNVSDTTAAYNATAVGNPAYVTGPTAGGQAVQLDGVDDYVQLPAGVASSENITLSMAVKWDGGANWQRVFDFGTGPSANMFLTPKSGDGTMRFAITTSGGDNEQALETSALPTGQWVNLTLTLGGNTGILYVNGKPQVAGQILLDPSDLAATLNYLGKSQYNDPLFKGAIADFKVYDYALSQLQVMDLTARNVTWVGGQNGNAWDNNATANFRLSTNVATAFAYVDNVTFDGTGTSAVTLAAAVSPRSVTVSGGSNLTFTGNGAITGPGTLTKSGTGTLVLANSGTNTYTGGTTISGGVLQIGNGGAAGSVGPGNIVNNAQLAFNRTGTLTQGVDFGLITGSGRVSVQAGTVQMTAANTYSGGTTIQGGTLVAKYAATTTSAASPLLSGNGADIQSGKVVFDYTATTSPAALVRSLLSTSFKAATTPGVMDSGVLRNTAATAAHGLGYRDDGAGSVIVMATLFGDADLDGGVSINDFNALSANFGQSSGKVWTQGDFDYDNGVSINDFNLLAAGFAQSVPASAEAWAGLLAFAAAHNDLAAFEAVTGVPEPTAAGLLSIGVAAGLRRRPRRRSTESTANADLSSCRLSHRAI